MFQNTRLSLICCAAVFGTLFAGADHCKAQYFYGPPAVVVAPAPVIVPHRTYRVTTVQYAAPTYYAPQVPVVPVAPVPVPTVSAYYVPTAPVAVTYTAAVPVRRFRRFAVPVAPVYPVYWGY